MTFITRRFEPYKYDGSNAQAIADSMTDATIVSESNGVLTISAGLGDYNSGVSLSVGQYLVVTTDSSGRRAPTWMGDEALYNEVWLPLP